MTTLENWRNKRRENRNIRQLTSFNGSEKGPDHLGVYFERTLDEAYYPGLHSEFLEERNITQVIQRQHRRNAEIGNSAEPLLIVPQLWLWSIDDILVSAYPIPRSWNKKLVKCDDLIDVHVAKTIWSHVAQFGTSYFDPKTKQSFRSTLDMFEMALVATLSDVRNYITNRVSQEINIATERHLLECIADIRNELDMIRTIIEQQEDVLDTFLLKKSDRVSKERNDLLQDINDYKKEMEGRFNAKDFSEEIEGLRELISKIEADFEEVKKWQGYAKDRIAKYTRRISKIERDAEKIAKTIDDMLNLSRTEASIKEARNSVVIGWAALAFAIITVIFTPLSFAASLMALPINRFVDHQYRYSDAEDDTRVYKSGYIARTFCKSPYDGPIDLTLTPSSGDRVRFVGLHWGDRGGFVLVLRSEPASRTKG